MRNARAIAVITSLLLGACVLALTVTLASGSSRAWVLPAFLAVVAVVATAVFTLMARAQRRRP